MQFKEYIEATEIIKGIMFLENPSPREFVAYFDKIEKNYSSRHDYVLRGLYFNHTIYWFPAFSLTHNEAALILKLDYRLCERTSAYRNSYNEIVLDFSVVVQNSGVLRNFNIDDDGILMTNPDINMS